MTDFAEIILWRSATEWNETGIEALIWLGIESWMFWRKERFKPSFNKSSFQSGFNHSGLVWCLIWALNFISFLLMDWLKPIKKLKEIKWRSIKLKTINYFFCRPFKNSNLNWAPQWNQIKKMPIFDFRQLSFFFQSLFNLQAEIWMSLLPRQELGIVLASL